MTTVIRIDPDDELPIILERLPIGAPCVIVLPPHARALNSLVGAKLLSRRAESLGSRVAVVTDEYQVMAHARAAGVPVASTVDEAQRILANGAAQAAGPTVPVAEPPVTLDTATHDPLATAPWPAATFIAADVHRDQFDDAAENRPVDATDHPDVAAGGAVDTSTGLDEAATFIRGHSSSYREAPGGMASRSASTAPRSLGSSSRRPRYSRWTWVPGPGRMIVTAAALGVPLLLLVGLAIYVLTGLLNPSATLTIHPRAGSVVGTSQVEGVLNLPPVKRTHSRVAMALAEQSEQYTISLPVRGIKILPGHVATGRLLLGNLTTKPLRVPAGTVFTAARNSAAFATTTAVTLPAAVETFSSVTFGTGRVSIRAVMGGSSGNVPPRAIVRVPAGFTGALKVENDGPTTGGTDIRERVVAPRDLAMAAASLFGILEQEALHDIARLHGGDVEQHVLYVARSPVHPALAPDHRSGSLKLSVVVHSVYVHRSDLQAAVRTALQPALALLPNTALIDRSVGWVATWQAAGPRREVITLDVTGRTSSPLDVAGLIRGITGRSKTAADSYLNGRGDLASHHLDLSPPWADHLPDDVTRIHVTIGAPE